jgi:hypothetical protein
MMRTLRFLPCLLLLFVSPLFLLPSAHGQTATATLSGTVVDQTGALIPGADLTAVNIATTLQRQATTNDQGRFVIPLLPPGTYTITAQHEGFAPVRVENVVLSVGDQKALQIQLQAGNVTENVQVTSDAPLVDESPAVGTVVDRQFVANLPLNGRSFQSLIALTPGVVITRAFGGNAGQFSVNGQRSNANYFTIDGVSANVGVPTSVGFGQSGGGTLPGFSASGGTNNLVSVDALEEFKIQTSSYAPEFGRTPGGQVSIVTRSGTNALHGTVFDYVRNDVLDANDWFANANRLKKPALRQNDFGGVLGGPIVQNRLFFFFSYEGLRLRQPQVSIVDVPSIAARQATPAALRPFIDAYPLPNGPDTLIGGVPNGFAQFSGSYSNPSKLNATSIRFDYAVNARVTVFGRYNHAPSETIQRGTGTLSNLSVTKLKAQTLTAGTMLNISPTINNDFRLNYSRNKGSGGFKLDNFGGAVPPSESLLYPQGFTTDTALYTFSIVGGVSAFYNIGTSVDNVQEQLNLVDTLSMIAGPHQLKFGIDFRRLTPNLGVRKYGQSARFSSVGIRPPGVLPPVGSVLSGTTSRTSIEHNPRIHLIADNFSAFAQDTWKIKQRLTLTYGIRWEVNPAPRSTDGPDFIAVTGLDNLPHLTLAPPGTSLWNTTYNNFAPRVGASYQLSQRPARETILRGGFGVFYDLGTSTAADAGSSLSGRVQFLNVPYPLTTAQAAPVPLRLNPPFDFLQLYDPDLRLPRSYQWNLAIEQSLGANQAMTASYVAALGRRLLRQTIEINSVSPISTQYRMTVNGATSDYHALQMQFRRRLSRGVQALVSYSWAKSIDDISNDDFAFSPGRAVSDFDIRHSFSTAFTYNIPHPDFGSVSRAILRDWSADAIFMARSATPINLIANSVVIGLTSTDVRPDLILGVPLYIDDPTAPGGRRLNRAAFAVPPTTPAPRQGTLGRNSLRGFPFWQLDFAVRRQFNFNERVNLQFRAEFFNLFNHPNFADPTASINSGLFGRSTQMLNRGLGTGGSLGGFSPIYQIGGPRSVQLALKIAF